jgi:hypothetical protein
MAKKSSVRRTASALSYSSTTGKDPLDVKTSLPDSSKSNTILWETYRTSPEIHHIVQSVISAMSRIVFIPLTKEGKELFDANGKCQIDNESLAEDSKIILERIKGITGGQSQVVGALGGCLCLAADAWLVGYEANRLTGLPSKDGLNDEEVWATFSRDRIEVKEHDQVLKIQTDSNKTIELTEYRLYRFWIPSLDKPSQADSWVTPLLRTIQLLTETWEALGATALSQLGAGAIIVPSEQDLPNADHRRNIEATEDPEKPGNIQNDTDFAQGLSEKMEEYIVDAAEVTDGANRAIPVVIPVDTDLREPKHIDLSRSIDPQLGQMIRELRYQISVGCPYPTEKLLGQNEAKFYQSTDNTRRIDQETFREVYEPICELIADGLTRCILHEDLLLLGYEPDEAEEIVVGWDNSNVISPVDNCEKAMQLRASGDITREEVRRACGWAAEAEGEYDQPAIPEATPIEQAQIVQQASAGLPANEGSGYARMSQSFVEKLGLICDQTITRMHERAGSRLLSVTSRPMYKELHQTMKALEDKEQIGLLEGMEQFANEKGETDQTLFAAALEKLKPQYVKVATASIVERNLRIANETGEDLDMADEGERISNGWEFLAAGLIALARKRFFNVVPDKKEPEKSLTHSIPSDLLKQVSAILGGADASQSGLYSLATGPVTLNAYARAGFRHVGWEWIYGDPATRTYPYEPHEKLSRKIASIDLSEFNGQYPNDHNYCQCELDPIFSGD